MKTITQLLLIVLFLGNSYAAHAQFGNKAPVGIIVDINKYINRSEVKEYISSDYVNEFNSILTSFSDHMAVFTNNNGRYIVISNKKYIKRHDNKIRLRFNIFWGTKTNLFQFKIGSNHSTKTVNEISVKNSNLTIGVKKDNTVFITNGIDKENYVEITRTEEGKNIINSGMFIPVYPKRMVKYHFTKRFKHIYVDSYKDNLVQGVTRFFSGSPGEMLESKVIKIVKFDCDKPHIYHLDGGQSYEMKNSKIMIPYCKIEDLEIDKSITGVSYFEAGLDYPLPWQSTN